MDDAPLIECAQCGKVLNDKSLWIVDDGKKTICEECYALNELTKGGRVEN